MWCSSHCISGCDVILIVPCLVYAQNVKQRSVAILAQEPTSPSCFPVGKVKRARGALGVCAFAVSSSSCSCKHYQPWLFLPWHSICRSMASVRARHRSDRSILVEMLVLALLLLQLLPATTISSRFPAETSHSLLTNTSAPSVKTFAPPSSTTMSRASALPLPLLCLLPPRASPKASPKVSTVPFPRLVGMNLPPF